MVVDQPGVALHLLDEPLELAAVLQLDHDGGGATAATTTSNAVVQDNAERIYSAWAAGFE